MNRRQFLAAAAALAAAPAFVRRAFGDSSCPLPARVAVPDGAPRRDDTFERAWRRALASGRALLVFVIPADDGLKYDRGGAFGELLNHGTDAQISPLGPHEVVCATIADVRALAPSVGGGEPLMVFVNPARPDASRRLVGELPSYVYSPRGSDWKEQRELDDEVADKRIAMLARLLAEVGPVDPLRGPEVRQRLTKHRVPGSHWANASGCGTSVEDDDPAGLMPACGMGHVPSKSSRFLYLYALTPGERYKAERAKMKP
jgi:hypothetical protein